MKKEKLFKGISIGAFSILYLLSGYFGLITTDWEYSPSFIAAILSVLFVVAFLVMTFAFSGNKIYLVLFSFFFGLLFLSIAIEFADRYFFDVSIRAFNEVVLAALLSYTLPVAYLTGSGFYSSVFSMLSLEKEAIITTIIFAVIVALFYVVFFALKPLKNKLFPAALNLETPVPLPKKDIIINIINVLVVVLLYFSASFFMVDGFPAYTKFSPLGALLSFAFVLSLYFMAYRFSNSKTYLVFFSVYFGIMSTTPIASLIGNLILPEHTTMIMLPSALNIFSFLFPTYQWFHAVQKAIEGLKIPIPELIVYLVMFLITIVIFYIVLFSSKRIKGKKKRKLTEE